MESAASSSEMSELDFYSVSLYIFIDSNWLSGVYASREFLQMNIKF